MNPETTNKVAESTNNLSANVVESGTVNFDFSEFSDTGSTIGEFPARQAYYATKSIITNIKSDTIPFVLAWFNLGQSATSYVGMNSFTDYENPYLKWSRHWYKLDKVTNNGNSVIRVNFYLLDSSANLSSGITLHYVILSANATESSGL